MASPEENLSIFNDNRSLVISVAFTSQDPDLAAVFVNRLVGRFFDGKREARANRQSYDPQARRRLWALSEELCGRLLEPVLRR